MDITPYVESLRHDLAAAAEAGGPEAKAAAERLALALDPAVRLALMDALSQAAAEITAELADGSVDVRLRGREPQFVVDVPTVPMPAATPAPAAGASGDDEPEDAEDGAVARITLRLPESVKYKAEELATKGGHSLNSWIVNVVRAATRERAVSVDIDLSSVPFLDGPGLPARARPLPRRQADDRLGLAPAQPAQHSPSAQHQPTGDAGSGVQHTLTNPDEGAPPCSGRSPPPSRSRCTSSCAPATWRSPRPRPTRRSSRSSARTATTTTSPSSSAATTSSSSSRHGGRGGLFGSSRDGAHVRVTMPHDSRLVTKLGSADVRVDGRLGESSLKSGSGDVRARRAVREGVRRDRLGRPADRVRRRAAGQARLRPGHRRAARRSRADLHRLRRRARGHRPRGAEREVGLRRPAGPRGHRRRHPHHRLRRPGRRPDAARCR